MSGRLLAVFQYEDEFLAAAEQLRAAGFDQLTLMSPVPLEEAYEVQKLGKSPVRRFALAGALLGAIGGFAMAAGTAIVFIMPTGGRPVIPLPPFFVITYEMTILLGVLATLLGFHVVSGLPAWRDAPYDLATNVDRFSILLEGVDHAGRAREIINQAGAEQVREVEDS